MSPGEQALVSRQYIRFDSRQVHYRTAGEGRIVVLIHQSPRNSRELLPLIHFLTREYQLLN